MSGRRDRGREHGAMSEDMIVPGYDEEMMALHVR
jgi:hypothetical protein